MNEKNRIFARYFEIMQVSIPSYKKIWQVSWPIMVGLLAESLVSVVDTAFLGHIGEIELGASAIAGTFYIIMFNVGNGFGTGTQILIGRRNGEKDYKKIGNITENSLYFIWLFSAVTVVLSLLFSRQILGFMIQSKEILDGAVRFLDIRVFTLFFSLGCVILRSFFVGIQLTKYIGLGAFIIAGTNFVLDYVLIFGKFGFPQMGLEGAALASVLAEVAGLLFFVIIIIRKIDLNKYNLFKFKKPQLSTVSKTLNLSIFTMLQNLVSLSCWFLFFVIIEKTGEKNLAASNIIRSFYVLMITPMWAYSASVSTLVSNAIGAGQRRYVFLIIRRVAVLGILTALIISIPTILFPKEIFGIYTNDISLIDIGYKALIVVVIANIILGYSGTAFSAVSATGNTNIALLIEGVFSVCYVFSVYYFATTYPNRVETFWYTEVIYYLLLGLGSTLYLRSKHWTKKVI